MKALVVALVAVFALGGCGESEAQKQREADEIQRGLEQYLEDVRQEVFLDCLEKANDQFDFNDPPFGCRR